MIGKITSPYRPNYPTVLVYMLQSSEYRVGPYLKWVWRTDDFTHVMQRRTLDRTRPAKLLLLALRLGIVLQIVVGLLLIYLGMRHHVAGGIEFGLAVIILYPFVWSHLIVLPLLMGRELSTKPQEQRLIAQSKAIFAKHSGIKIAVAGSYGKTSMKELLNTVLSERLQVAATPANKNVSVSHAQFAAKLTGDEEVLIIEYGEGAPGDVARFAQQTYPTHGIITGLAPAHLEEYKTLQAAGEDIFALADYLQGKQVYVNDDASTVKPFLKDNYELFDIKGALGWRVEKIQVELTGTSFTLRKGKQSLQLHSGLVGRHHIGSLSLVTALGLQFGLTTKQVIAGIAKTQPFEHRMQPYQLAGAWIIDDTYNGNLEGIRAGTQLLQDLDAKRKIYITPGLVDQGPETERVHHEMGKLIAAAHPDLVVLMQNSVTTTIEAGLHQAHFTGELRIEDNPLEFYTNLKHFVAVGDLVVMQNDWTDNYA
jgi:UDP-N-acetylmuramoyl-tripeptide--D-alanyl-D-alanine ligase